MAHGTAEPRSSVRPGSSEACSAAGGGGAAEAAAHPAAALRDAEQPVSSRACSAASHKGAELFAAPVAAELTDAGQRDVGEDSGRVGNAGVSTAAPAAAQGTYISGLRIRSVLQLASGKAVTQAEDSDPWSALGSGQTGSPAVRSDVQLVYSTPVYYQQ